ncbi:MAG: NADPH-dependent F420 reductase [Chloroflexi bacterium]|nr:NADPH-dependent F420 reductase [Chloroflexota bacterium]MCH8115671.1 NADPH-dependent F420 reductase [Chloroflexota bacterium]MCI0776282.1 NADPH-dependent F420 reductase [Chloroflexota bacterium]MCI0804507.1 NADPH-dependent F420 reductase [Chloroflexota bacterium]MCI0809290.1 NADPH-dependent F420 reductase [Chloroflexota bacterium]
MRIAVIGSGSVGSGLARGWSAAGHSVVIGSRSPESERVTALVAEIGNGVEAATPPDSVAGADVIVLAVPWSAVEESISSLGDVSGRVIIDATNPFVRGLDLALGHTWSGGEQVAELASGARVVKALNVVDARLLDGHLLDGRQISIPIAGDDADAKQVASKLIYDLGFDVVDAGALVSSRLLEPLALLMIRLSMKKSLGAEIGFRVLRESRATFD